MIRRLNLSIAEGFFAVLKPSFRCLHDWREQGYLQNSRISTRLINFSEKEMAAYLLTLCTWVHNGENPIAKAEFTSCVVHISHEYWSSLGYSIQMIVAYCAGKERQVSLCKVEAVSTIVIFHRVACRLAKMTIYCFFSNIQTSATMHCRGRHAKGWINCNNKKTWFSSWAHQPIASIVQISSGPCKMER